MTRGDNKYWQRLRRDRRSNAAVLLAALAALAGTISVISISVEGTQYQARANLLYWLLMAPMVWWVVGLTTFAPRYVRLWTPALALACLASIVAALATMREAGGWTAQTIACVVTLAAAAASLLARRGSLVEREGPAR